MKYNQNRTLINLLKFDLKSKTMHHCILFFLLLYNPLSGQYDQLSNGDILKIIHNSPIHNSLIGLHVKNISSNEVLLNINGHIPMTPASSQKIITTFTALDLMGFDFQFATQLYYSGEIERDGTLLGDIVLVGSGDPSLGSYRAGTGPDMEEWLKQLVNTLKKAGITCIDGNIIIDGSRFDKEYIPASWAWSDVGNYYGGGVSGININENEYEILFDRNVNIGEITPISTIKPPFPYISIENRVSLGPAGSGDQAYIYGGQENYHKIIRGTIPQGKGKFSIRGSIPDPPMFVAMMVATALADAGIGFQNYACHQHDVSRSKKIAEWKSKPLHFLVKQANINSINLYCEAFLKNLSASGSYTESLNILNNHIRAQQLDTNLLYLVDGSGLSAQNAIQPRFFTSFLSHYYRKFGIERALSLLPKVGKDGTVKNLMRTQNYTGNAYLKSGYIGGVLTYNGYIQGQSSNWHAVSFMCNHFKCKTIEVRETFEKILMQIYLSS